VLKCFGLANDSSLTRRAFAAVGWMPGLGRCHHHRVQGTSVAGGMANGGRRSSFAHDVSKFFVDPFDRN